MFSKRFQWGLSTLGCPDLTFEEVSCLAAKYGIEALELRALDNRIDLLEHWRSSPPPLAEWKALLASRNQRIVMLDTPCTLIGPRPDMETLAGFAEWAELMGAPYLRVFDGGKIDSPSSEEDLDQATRFWTNWLELRAKHGWKTDVLVETHDAFCNSATALRWIERQPIHPGIIWDVHHTWRFGSEAVGATWGRLAPYVRHLHLKDSLPAGDGVDHVVPGKGDVPFEEVFRLLDGAHFPGVVSLEIEKWWHPEIPPIGEFLDACVDLSW